MHIGRIGPIVGLGAAAVAAGLVFEFTRARNEQTDRIANSVDRHRQDARDEFESRATSDGILVADAATRLISTHDLNGDSNVENQLDDGAQISGGGHVVNEWKVWSQHVWPWHDPEAHLVHLFPRSAPASHPVEVQDDTSWLQPIAAVRGDKDIADAGEIQSFVQSFDTNRNGVLQGNELDEFAQSTHADGYITARAVLVDGPFMPTSHIARELERERMYLLGRTADGIELLASPLPPSSDETGGPSVRWRVSRSDHAPDRAAGESGFRRLAERATAEQVQRFFELEGIEVVGRP